MNHEAILNTVLSFVTFHLWIHYDDFDTYTGYFSKARYVATPVVCRWAEAVLVGRVVKHATENEDQLKLSLQLQRIVMDRNN